MQNEISFHKLGNPGWSFDKTLFEAQKLGFEPIEIRGIEDKMLAYETAQFLPENQTETKRKLMANNIRICCFGISLELFLCSSINLCAYLRDKVLVFPLVKLLKKLFNLAGIF